MDINNLFKTIYTSPVTVTQFFTMAGFSLLFGILYTFIISFRNIGAGIAIGGGPGGMGGGPHGRW